MPISRKVVLECPKCGYLKVVLRGDNLPDDSMFQKCPKCGAFMKDSDKSVKEAESIIEQILNIFR